jgi:sarcosine oxidase subunit beta
MGRYTEVATEGCDLRRAAVGSDMHTRHAVILGAGISGVLVAHALLRRGWRVTVLEAEHIGAGSSSRTAAGIRQQFSTRSTVRGMRYAVAAYRELQEELGLDQPILVQSGYLFLTAGEEAWAAAQRRVALQHEAGLAEVEALLPDELVRRFPWVDPEAVSGGSWCPTDGFLHPPLIYGEGARRVRELGGVVLQRAPVVEATRRGERLISVTTPKGEVGGDLFIDCTNAWSPRVAQLLGGAALPVSPLKRYLWFLRRDDDAMSAETLAAMPLVIGPTGVYVRPENRDTLLMGHAHDAAPEPTFEREDQDRIEAGFSHADGIDSRAFTAWAQIASALPAVGLFAGAVATTSGYYAATPDHNPFLGYDPQIHNLLRLVGFSGHGAMFGPFTAAVAVALAEAGRDVPSVALPTGDVSLEEFRIGRAMDHAEAMVI